MPPAVAQAPMVTRKRDMRRTSWMRSASCGVVIDPSTSERSYGPFTTARDASGKLAISTAPASASSSSSQSSRLNWQPSQDENFQTASFGLRVAAISNLSLPEPFFDCRIGEYGSVLADEERPKLAMAAQPDGALHVALHRDKDAFVGNPAALEFADSEA